MDDIYFLIDRANLGFLDLHQGCGSSSNLDLPFSWASFHFREIHDWSCGVDNIELDRNIRGTESGKLGTE